MNLQAKVAANNTQNSNIKVGGLVPVQTVMDSYLMSAQDYLHPFVAPCKEYLSKEPWAAFIGRSVPAWLQHHMVSLSLALAPQ